MKIFILLSFSLFILISCKKDITTQTNWTKINYVESDGLATSIADICFISDKVGFMVGQRGNIMPSAMVYKTIDGGATWNWSKYNNIAIGGGGGSFATDIFFIKPSEIFINVSSFAYTNFVSKDEGQSWKWTSSVQNSKTNTIILDSQTLISGYQRSLDGGLTWEKINVPVDGVTSYSFKNKNFIVYATTDGIIAKSTDLGISWDTLYNNSSDFFNSIVFSDSSTIIAGGSNILKSSDNGKNWKKTSNEINVLDIEFIDKNIGFAVTTSYSEDFNSAVGKILKTVNGGETWSENYFSKEMGFATVYVKDNNTVFAAGSHGKGTKTAFIYRTTTQGN